MQEAKKFALDVSLTFIASIINMLLTFVISIILARYLGAYDLGVYRLTYTFYGVATMVGALGIPVAVIKYVAEYKDDEVNLNKIVSSAIITSLIAGIIISIIIYLSSQTFADLFKMPQIKSLLDAAFSGISLYSGQFDIIWHIEWTSRDEQIRHSSDTSASANDGIYCDFNLLRFWCLGRNNQHRDLLYRHICLLDLLLQRIFSFNT